MTDQTLTSTFQSLSSGGFQTFIDALNDPLIVVNAQGNIVMINPAVEKTFGWSQQELTGKAMSCLMPKNIADQHGRDLQRLVSKGDLERIEGRRETFGMDKAGRVFPIHLSMGYCQLEGQPLFTGLVRDLSAEYQVKSLIARHQTFLEGVLNSPEEVILVFDATRRILLANWAARQLLGEDQGDSVVGKRWSELFEGRYALHQNQLIDSVFKTGKAERVTHTFAGRYVDTQFSPGLTDQGCIEFVTSFSLDITELKQSQARLLKESKRAGLANRAKTEFLANMSHELRTPLNSVLGFTQVLQEDTNLDQDQQESLGYISDAGQYLTHLIEDILDLARIESGRLPLNPVPLDVVAVVREAVQMSSPALADKQLELFIDVPDQPTMVCADPTRLKQVVLNFLDNAVKYNVPQGRINVQVASPHAGSVRIRIQDTGVGIPEDKHGYLFKPFNRLGYEASGIPGTGIGLVLSRKLIDEMGGRIEFQSKEHQGAQFDVILPVCEPVQPEPPPDMLMPRQESVTTEDFHVLYAEETHSNLVLMQRFIDRRPGWRMSSASSGFEALQLAQQELPDVLLLDMTLPDMSGLELAVLFNSNELVQHIPIVAVTADGRYETRQACEYAGIHLVHTKPIDFKALENTLRALIDVETVR
jgi:protein-histidine pros-kinase